MIDKKKSGQLRDSEIDMLLANDIADRIEALEKALPWFERLDDARQGVLINMAFQLGTQGLLAFKTTLSHIEAGRYDKAGSAMLQSKWATQTPERAKRLAVQMETGKWQFAPGA